MFRTPLAAILLLAGSVQAGQPRLFGPESLAEIEAAHAGSPLVVHFWSRTCAPCLAELPDLAKLTRAYPEVPVVLVATDRPAESARVGDILHENELANLEWWIFRDSDPQRLRYAVDRTWYGELPRSYLYPGDGSRRAVSGPLKPSDLSDLTAASN